MALTSGQQEQLRRQKLASQKSKFTTTAKEVEIIIQDLSVCYYCKKNIVHNLKTCHNCGFPQLKTIEEQRKFIRRKEEDKVYNKKRNKVLSIVRWVLFGVGTFFLLLAFFLISMSAEGGALVLLVHGVIYFGLGFLSFKHPKAGFGFAILLLAINFILGIILSPYLVNILANLAWQLPFFATLIWGSKYASRYY